MSADRTFPRDDVGHPGAPGAHRDSSAAGVLASPAAGGWALLARSVMWPSLICVTWAVLALRSPHATYHLMPLMAGAAWPVSVRIQGGTRLTHRIAGTLALGGLFLTLATAAGLAVAGALAGPSVWHGSGALETPLAALAGMAWGWRVATRRRRGLVERLS